MFLVGFVGNAVRIALRRPGLGFLHWIYMRSGCLRGVEFCWFFFFAGQEVSRGFPGRLCDYVIPGSSSVFQY